MADQKISQLTGASTPLAGTEVLPIVQSGSTKKVSVANLTAGRAISATEVTASTGNFVIGTAGKGIDFSINPSAPGMTSELLNDYEEGTWTPEVAFGGASVGVTYAARQGRYTKVGRAVTVSFYILLSSKGSSAGNLSVTGLPFADGSATSACCMFLFSGFAATYGVGVGDSGNGTSITSIRTYSSGSLTNTSLNNDAFFWGTYTYQA